MAGVVGVGTAARRVGEVVVFWDVEDVATGSFGHGQRVRRRPQFAAAEEDAPGKGVAHDEQRRGDQHEHYRDDDHHQLMGTKHTHINY